jgi:site-specific DNA-methyltransferase (adenine-specific)
VLGDCLEKMKNIPDGSVDAIIADLPYGTTANNWDSIIPMNDLWTAWKRVCKPGAPIILFTQQPFTTTVAASNLKQLKTEWIWEKPQGTGFLNCRKYPLKSHENILVFCDGLPPYTPQKTTGCRSYRTGKGRRSSNYGHVERLQTVNTDGTRYPKTVLRFTPDKGLHPTQKPVALIEYLIKTYTIPNAVILDCCIGSGTTAVAAINTGRQFIGIERDPKYHAIAVKRAADAQAMHLERYWSQTTSKGGFSSSSG